MKRWVSAVFGAAVICALLSPAAALAQAAAKPDVTVPASFITTVDGQRLWSHDRNERRAVASTIKMLNALVVRERADLDDVVTVARTAARTEDGVGLVRGQKITVRRLLQLMMVCSSNDAASALAIHVSGSEKQHVARMNEKAEQLGLTRTRAVDPHGLSKKERSTARDLSVLGREVLKDRYLRKVMLMESVVLHRPGHKPRRIKATNELLGEYRGIEGVKTGFTYPAGYCFVGAAKRGNLELVGVVLGASSKAARFSQMRKLLSWGFKRYYMKRLVSSATTMGAVTVLVSEDETVAVTVHAAEETSRAVVRGIVVDRQITLPATLTAPISRGDQLGTVTVSQGGTRLATVKLLADADVDQAAELPSATAKPSSPAFAPSAASASFEARDGFGSRIATLSRRVLLALAATL